MDNFWGSSINWAILGDHFSVFKVFLKVNVWEYFLGGMLNFEVFCGYA